jgi:hypothetical protein
MRKLSDILSVIAGRKREKESEPTKADEKSGVRQVADWKAVVQNLA